ncbi:hypothetical protein J4458_05160 [Candidatus Woesearchaeota archaeon]|nr:hypothetical protein [Candidatus Woesearchaeota archaeon]
MVKIDVLDYLNRQKGSEKLIENFPEIKDELEKLGEINESVENFEKSSFFHSGFFLKKAKNRHLALKIKMLNSELREKNEICERLHGLAHNLGMLRTLLAVKDEKVFKRINDSFLTNDYSSIPVVIKELNDFKDKINELEKNYKSLINENYASIDFKVKHEEHLDRHLKNLHETHGRQKKLLMSMGVMFTKLCKDILKKR